LLQGSKLARAILRHLAHLANRDFLSVEVVLYNTGSPVESVVVGVFPAGMFREWPYFAGHTQTRISHGQSRKKGMGNTLRADVVL
jgi:hypothetical protein